MFNEQGTPLGILGDTHLMPRLGKELAAGLFPALRKDEEGFPALSNHSIGPPFPAAASPTKKSRLYVARLLRIDDEATRGKVSSEPDVLALLQLLFRADPAVYCVEGHWC